MDGDGCSSSCSVERGWLCSRPSVNSSAPSSVCTTTCGDGVRAGAEACDSGSAQGTAAAAAGEMGCDASCAVIAGYTCKSSAAGKSICSMCGNGVREAAELCDDGNTVSGDGCAQQCVVEAGWACAASQSDSSKVHTTYVCFH